LNGTKSGYVGPQKFTIFREVRPLTTYNLIFTIKIDGFTTMIGEGRF